MGDWLKVYGSSIYGADGIPVKPPENILFTVKPHKVFVHVLDWNGKELFLPGIDKIIENRLDTIRKVYMLADPDKRPLDFTVADGKLAIDLSSCPLPKNELNQYAEVIVLSE